MDGNYQITQAVQVTNALTPSKVPAKPVSSPPRLGGGKSKQAIFEKAKGGFTKHLPKRREFANPLQYVRASFYNKKSKATPKNSYAIEATSVRNIAVEGPKISAISHDLSIPSFEPSQLDGGKSGKSRDKGKAKMVETAAKENSEKKKKKDSKAKDKKDSQHSRKKPKTSTIKTSNKKPRKNDTDIDVESAKKHITDNDLKSIKSTKKIGKPEKTRSKAKSRKAKNERRVEKIKKPQAKQQVGKRNAIQQPETRKMIQLW